MCTGTVLDDPTFEKVIKITGDEPINARQLDQSSIHSRRLKN